MILSRSSGRDWEKRVDFSYTTKYLGKIPGKVLDKDKYLLKMLLASRRKAITHKWL